MTSEGREAALAALGAAIAERPPTIGLAARRWLRHRVVSSGRRVVVLDDDPTGTQSVSGVPAITAWGPMDVRWALTRSTTATFVSTNSRSLPADAAATVTSEVVDVFMAQADDLQLEVDFLSRGDSTLRGHFHEETAAIAAGLCRSKGRAVDAIVLCPAFPQAGRVTYMGYQFVKGANGFVHADESQYAKDASFGYPDSYLPNWVSHKSGGRWRPSDVVVVPLGTVRAGAASVASAIDKVEDGAPVVVDAVCVEDLFILADVLLTLGDAGKSIVTRCGPSFVPARAGLDIEGPIEDLTTLVPSHRPGLVVVGSHVRNTTEQVSRAAEDGHLGVVEVDVAQLLSASERAGSLERTTSQVISIMKSGRDGLFCTSRVLIEGTSAHESLDIAAKVANAMVEIASDVVARVDCAWVLAKGGITSADVLSRVLKIRRGWIVGQLLPGQVSLWTKDRADTPPCAVFPGNTGDADSLRIAVERLRGAARRKA